LSASADEDSRRRFRADALRWERWFNGCSPRTAAQYVDWAASAAPFPWDTPANPRQFITE
jgi:hypothetical protein